MPEFLKYPTLQDAILMAEQIGVSKIRDLGLLDSALHRPQSELFGEEAYVGFETKAAALLESVIRNQALYDGNKRLGFALLYLFSRMNRRVLVASVEESTAFIVSVAGGEKSLKQIAKWISAHVALDR